MGKSTLLKAIASYEIKGYPVNVRVLYVEQEVRGNDVKNVFSGKKILIFSCRSPY